MIFIQLSAFILLVMGIVRVLELTPERINPQKNIITKALGVDYRLDSEFTTAPLQKGDILLLCSDGLTNAVPREQLEQLLRTGRFYDLPDLLIRTANENGGPDNITALLLCVEEVR